MRRTRYGETRGGQFLVETDVHLLVSLFHGQSDTIVDSDSVRQNLRVGTRCARYGDRGIGFAKRGP